MSRESRAILSGFLAAWALYAAAYFGIGQVGLVPSHAEAAHVAAWLACALVGGLVTGYVAGGFDRRLSFKVGLYAALFPALALALTGDMLLGLLIAAASIAAAMGGAFLFSRVLRLPEADGPGEGLRRRGP